MRDSRYAEVDSMEALVFNRVYIFPEPCLGDGVAERTVGECINKIREEVWESLDAYEIWAGTEAKAHKEEAYESLAEELTDVITACTTCLDRLGYDFEARQSLQYRVNEKNRKRDYHKE